MHGKWDKTTAKHSSLCHGDLEKLGSSPLLSDDVENDIMAPLSVGFDIESLEHLPYKDANIA